MNTDPEFPTPADGKAEGCAIHRVIRCNSDLLHTVIECLDAAFEVALVLDQYDRLLFFLFMWMMAKNIMHNSEYINGALCGSEHCGTYWLTVTSNSYIQH